MMSQQSKRELHAEVQARYLKASKAEKQKILDEFSANTGYHRKYAIRILKHGYKHRPLLRKPKGRKAIYRREVVEVLEQIWEIYGRICSKRLHPYLPEGIKVLKRCGEIELLPEIKELLLHISRSSIDRCLAHARFNKPRGLSTTKPGTLLKKNIPVRTFADWNEDQPGFMEVDLVAHCGESAAGQFLYTLTCTDLCTGWTEPIALPRRSQEAVCNSIKTMRQDLPSPPFPRLRRLGGWELTQIMAVNSSTICTITIVWMRRSPSHALAHTRRMIRRMSSKRIGPWYVMSSAMTGLKAMNNMPCWRIFMPTCVCTSISSNLSSNSSAKSALSTKSFASMISPKRLINA